MKAMGMGRYGMGYSLLICVAVSAAGARWSHALDARGVLVLYNNASPEGKQIADYYARVHPGVRLLGLSGVPLTEDITVSQYLQVIRPQVRAALDDSVDVIVTTRGLPLRLYNETTPASFPYTYTDSSGGQHTVFSDSFKRFSSLESELTRIDTFGTWKQLGDQTWWHPPAGSNPAANPYFHLNASFDHSDPTFGSMRLSSRLDGYSAADVMAGIRRAQTAYLVPTYHQIVADNSPAVPAAATLAMEQLAAYLASAGQKHTYDMTTAAITTASTPVLGYVSHGVNDGPGGLEPGYVTQQLKFQLANGAVYHTWESFNAITFQAGYNGQGLVADWLKSGGTAAVGHVQEPGASVFNVANEDQLFRMMLEGYTFAEAAWSSIPQLSYVNTVVGDPLMVWKPAIAGDANLDGTVSFSDLVSIMQNFNMANATWRHGDFDGDGFATISDLITAMSMYGYSDPTATFVPLPEISATAAAFAMVPEPAMAGVLSAVAMLLGIRRRRF